MNPCPKCGFINPPDTKNCQQCRVNLEYAFSHVEEFGLEKGQSEEYLKEQAEEQRVLDEKTKNLPLSTTHLIAGREIVEDLGIVASEVVLGTGFISEFFASISDDLGRRSGKFQDKLEKARTIAFTEMRFKAAILHADAVIGVELDYMTVKENMFVVCVYGTAVRTKPIA